MQTLNLAHFVDVDFRQSLASHVGGKIGHLDLTGFAQNNRVFYRTTHNDMELYRGECSVEAAKAYNAVIEQNQ